MRVLHVLASNQRRGAEIFARDLALRLDDVHQRVAIVHGHPGGLEFPAPATELAPNGKTRSSLSAMRALDEIVRTWRPDLIQAHGGEPLKLLAPALLRGRPAVVYRRVGLTPDWMAKGLRIRVHRALIKRAHAVVAVANAVGAETIERFGVPSERVTVIPNAVDAERVRPRRTRGEVRASLGVNEDATAILFAGALNEEKNPLAVLDVADRVARSLAETVFLIAGEGIDRKRLERRIAASVGGHRVMLLGPRDDLPDLMAASDALLCTSNTEGLPGVLIEAGLSGVPVVAFDVGGVSEVVVHQSTGLLVPAGDVDQLSALLVALVVDQELATRLGRKAAERCRAMFEIGPVAKRYRALYETLAAGARANSEEFASAYEETIN